MMRSVGQVLQTFGGILFFMISPLFSLFFEVTAHEPFLYCLEDFFLAPGIVVATVSGTDDKNFRADTVFFSLIYWTIVAVVLICMTQ